MTASVQVQVLLDLWEHAEGLPRIERDLALAQAAGLPRSDLLQRPIGATNRGVLDLRQRLLGDEMSATAVCPACSERVEFALDIAAFDTADQQADGELPGSPWRAPTPADLLAVADELDPVAALRARCLVGEAEPGEQDVEAVLTAADPLAETLIDLACPACGTTFAVDFDVGAFVWLEVQAAARRALLQIDTLARTYGWTESEILALPQARRAAYLRMASGGVP
jgi:hypothetical protein